MEQCGSVKKAFIQIVACRNCLKRITLDALKKVITRRFGIIGEIYSYKAANVLLFYGENAVRFLKRIAKYVHHPLRRLRIELILAYHDGRISREEFKRLYNMTKYKRGRPDIKRNNALEALARTAPQTHTHGDKQPIKRN